MENFENHFKKFWDKFWKISRNTSDISVKLFVKFRITNGNISVCFEKYYQNFWVLFWKFSKKNSEGFENYYYGEFRKVIGVRKFWGNLYIFWNSEETDICSKILRKFKETMRKLLKQAINFFWNFLAGFTICEYCHT